MEFAEEESINHYNISGPFFLGIYQSMINYTVVKKLTNLSAIVKTSNIFYTKSFQSLVSTKSQHTVLSIAIGAQA